MCWPFNVCKVAQRRVTLPKVHLVSSVVDGPSRGAYSVDVDDSRCPKQVFLSDWQSLVASMGGFDETVCRGAAGVDRHFDRGAGTVDPRVTALITSMSMTAVAQNQCFFQTDNPT